MAMIPGATDAAKLARAPRLEDVLLSAAAVPLPIDLSPSRLPEPNLDTTDASTDAKDAHPSASATVEAQGVQGASVAERAPADASAQDAVVKSLQAAHDAIHDSLQSNGSDEPAPDVANVDPVPASPAGDMAQSAHLVPGPMNALSPLDIPDDLAALFPASTAAGALSNLIHDVQSAVGDLGAVIGGLLGPVAGAPIDLAAAVAPAVAVVDNLAAPVEHVAQSAVSLILPADSEAHADATAAPTPSHTASAPAAPPPQSGPEAVTVPSLHGAGFDALAGLLQPATTSADATHDAAPGHFGFDDLSLLPPIGLEDVAHHDQAASQVTHTLAHALPSAGSGLI